MPKHSRMNSAGSHTWKLYSPCPMMRIMPKSLSRIMMGLGSTPLHADELFKTDIVDVGLFRHIPAVLPRAELGKDGNVVGRKLPCSCRKHVRDLPFRHEYRRLGFPHDQLRAFHDLIAVGHGELVDHCIAVGFRPRDDFKQILFDETHFPPPICYIISIPHANFNNLSE